MSFKDQLAKDTNTFINPLEFADVHNVDGNDISIVIDSDILQKRPRFPADLYHAADGVFISQIKVFANPADFEYEPVIGQHLKLDDKVYLVNACDETQGILEITLEVNES